MHRIFKGLKILFQFMDVILQHSNLPHVSATHVATFRMVRTKIQYTISKKDPRVHTYTINTTLFTL
jgi:hypothetical protein